MVASYYGHIDCVRELVLQGADINLQREVGEVLHSNRDWLSDRWFITNNKKSVVHCFLPIASLSLAVQCMYKQGLFSWWHQGIRCLEFITENEMTEVRLQIIHQTFPAHLVGEGSYIWDVTPQCYTIYASAVLLIGTVIYSSLDGINDKDKSFTFWFVESGH